MSDGLTRILGVVEERGLSIHVSPEGKPFLRGPREEVTAALKDALDAYRDEILASFARDPPAPPQPEVYRPREWRWRFGQGYTETPADEWIWQHEDRHPVGAWWFRRQGETTWQTVPGRPATESPQ